MKLPTVNLNDGNMMPLIGFGTGTAWFKEGGRGPFEQELVDLLNVAIRSGFTHIDGAESYGTEQEIGQVIKESGLPRDQIFVTSKVQDTIDDIPGAMEQTLKRLGLDYVDLYMIHWPYFAKTDDDLQAAWKEMEKLKHAGKAKSIGVSNYLRPHLEATLKTATIIPAVNQIEFHPYLQRANGYVPWMKSQGIQVEAFKPMVPVTLAKGGPLDWPLAALAEKHSVPVDAILLRWQIQQGVVPITTSRHASRLEEYAAATRFELSHSEVQQISSVGLAHHYRAWGTGRFAPDDRT